MDHLFKGDLRDYLKRKGALKPTIAVKFALDIARLVMSFPILSFGRHKFPSYFVSSKLIV
jgi:hypothetical protein